MILLKLAATNANRIAGSGCCSFCFAHFTFSFQKNCCLNLYVYGIVFVCLKI